MSAPVAPRPLLAGLLLGGLFAGALVLARGARLEPADFTFNNGSEVSTLDPAKVSGQPEGRVLRAIYEGLIVKHPETLAPEPGAAASWELSPDGRTYTFHLQPEGRWSDGAPVTAHDFVYSWRRLLAPGTGAGYAALLHYVVGAEAYHSELDDAGEPLHDPETIGVRALDDLTLEVELRDPTPFFIDLCGFYPLYPVCRHAIESAKERWPHDWEIEWLRPENLVTNGPFRIVDRRVNDRIRLVKNELYWDADHVAFRTIDVLAIEQDATMLNLYLTGGCDWIDRINTNVAPEMMPREDFVPVPYLNSYFYRVNVTKPPYDDARVRRALSMTIPRERITKYVMRMGQQPALQLVPPGIDGYTSPLAPAEDAAAARALLAEAGFGPGGAPFPPIEIHYNTSEAHAAIAQVIALAWQNELGIETKLRNEEWKVYLDSQKAQRYDVSRAGWIGDYADPNTFLEIFMSENSNNRTGWKNAEFDALVRSAASEPDPAARLRTLERAEALLLEELPILPIYIYVSQNAFAPRLGGFANNLQDEHFPKHWYWMDDAELAAKRAAQPADWLQAEPHGPPEGLYSPAQARARDAR